MCSAPHSPLLDACKERSAQGIRVARSGSGQVLRSHAQLPAERLDALSQRAQLQLHHLHPLRPRLLRRLLPALPRAPPKQDAHLRKTFTLEECEDFLMPKHFALMHQAGRLHNTFMLLYELQDFKRSACNQSCTCCPFARYMHTTHLSCVAMHKPDWIQLQLLRGMSARNHTWSMMMRSRTAPTRMYCGRGSARQATMLRSQPAADVSEPFVP